MKTMKQRGFTLIELLVVIAIIGILSAVVLASLNQARDQGNDAAIKSQMSSLRSEAEVYYSQNGNYGADVTAGSTGDCSSGIFSDMSNIISGIEENAGSDATCAANSSEWAVSVPLTSTSSDWCVDSTGAAMGTSTIDSPSC